MALPGIPSIKVLQPLSCTCRTAVALASSLGHQKRGHWFAEVDTSRQSKLSLERFFLHCHLSGFPWLSTHMMWLLTQELYGAVSHDVLAVSMHSNT